MPQLNKVITDDEFEITLHRAAETPSEKLVITFGGQPSGISQKGTGTDFALSLEYDTIFVAQKHGTQYQGLSLAQFEDIVGPVARNWDDVICYGCSLGGYAALYFGGILNARIIAAAPMLPAWKRLAIPSYADLSVRHIALKYTPLSSHNPVVIFDPMIARDQLLIDEMVLPAYPDARQVRVPYAGHTVHVALSQAKLLDPILQTFIDDDVVLDFDPPAEGTATWHGERGCHLISSDPRLARIELEKSLAIEPSRRIFNQLIQCLVDLGELGTAQDLLDFARKKPNKHSELSPPRRIKLLKAGLVV